MDEMITAIRKLKDTGKLEEARKTAVSLLAIHPHDAMLLYECASLHDMLGKEREAVPYYVKALEQGLPLDEKRKAILGLGSTYRTLGEYTLAKETLEKGLLTFPDAHEFVIFYAMVLYNLKKYDKAMELLLTMMMDVTSDPSILQYKKAILFYADKLDHIWD